MYLRKVKASATLRATMIRAGKGYLGNVPVELEVTAGDTWAVK